MTNERLKDLIAAYGANPDAWPLADQEEGRAALVSMSNHKLAEEIRLDNLLNSLPPVAPPPDLVARLMPSPTEPQRSAWAQLKQILFPNAKAWPASMALASLCVGIVAGYAIVPQLAQPDISEALLTAAFDTDPLFAALDEDLS